MYDFVFYNRYLPVCGLCVCSVFIDFSVRQKNFLEHAVRGKFVQVCRVVLCRVMSCRVVSCRISLSLEYLDTVFVVLIKATVLSPQVLRAGALFFIAAR